MIEILTSILHQIYDVEGIIRWGGMVMLITIVFAETGLLIGFFLPGDSLLVTAGVFAAPGHLDIWTLVQARPSHASPPKTIILARFVPIVRTFAPVVAGVAEMQYRRFVTYNVVGGILWVRSTSLLGYSLGRVVPDIDRHIHVVIVVVVILSILPGVYELWRARTGR